MLYLLHNGATPAIPPREFFGFARGKGPTRLHRRVNPGSASALIDRIRSEMAVPAHIAVIVNETTDDELTLLWRFCQQGGHTLWQWLPEIQEFDRFAGVVTRA